MINLYIKLDPRELDSSSFDKIKNCKIEGSEIFISGIILNDNFVLNLETDQTVYILEMGLGEFVDKLDLNFKMTEDFYYVYLKFEGDINERFVTYEPRLYKYNYSPNHKINDTITGNIQLSNIYEGIEINSKIKYETECLPTVFNEDPVKSFSFLSADHWYGLIKMGLKLAHLGLKEKGLECFNTAWQLQPYRLEPLYFYLKYKDSLKRDELEIKLLKKLSKNIQYPVLKIVQDEINSFVSSL